MPFPFHVICSLLSHSVVPQAPEVVLLIFLSSAVSPGHELTPEYLELGASDKKVYLTFVFLCWAFMTQLFMIFSGSTHLPIKFIISFTDKWYSMVYMYHNFITLLSELDHLGFFYFLNTVKKPALHMQSKFLWILACHMDICQGVVI